MPRQKALAADAETKKQAKRVARALAKDYADAECALVHGSPFELLAATILSAQCTDERVNVVTPKLFAEYPTAERLAAAKQNDVEQIIKSTGFFRSKAASLLGMARALVEKHGGEVPQTLEELVALPGVGRKTANVVLGTCFGIPSGVVVDTHVRRLTYRLGLTASRNPDVIERELMALLPAREWIDFSHRLIHHGRRICTARN
ncbi:MAG: endonuclease III, partial [Planctomycetaceae bacterium]